MHGRQMIDLKQVIKFYDHRAISYGPSHKSAAWSTEASRINRFEQFNYLLPNEDYSLNDFGCGDGALLRYLIAEKKPPKEYSGYDISENALSRFNPRGPSSPCDTITRCIDKIIYVADYSVASGIFNAMMNNDRGVWETYIQSSIENMADMSRKGFGFNMLIKASDPKLYASTPDVWLRLCSGLGAVTVQTGYVLDDFTLLVRKR